MNVKPADSVPGLVTLRSAFPVGETLDRLEKLLAQKNIQVFARIDHAAGAAKVKLALRPTQVLLLGNPAAGTPLMQAAQTIGIDLPLKVLAWEDAAGECWLGYNDPAYLAQRHGITDRHEVINSMAAGLEALAHAAAATVSHKRSNQGI